MVENTINLIQVKFHSKFKIIIIEDSKTLVNLTSKIQRNNIKVISVDTEFDSIKKQLSLIQIYYEDNLEGQNYVLIFDLITLNLKTSKKEISKELRKITDNENIQKIFHSFPSDREWLQQYYGLNCKNVFDTQYIHSKITNKKRRIGLKDLIETYLDIRIQKNKDSEFHSQWGERPLTQEQIEYVCLDVIYLIPVSNILRKLLSEKKIQLLNNSFYSEDIEINNNQNLMKCNIETDISRKFWKSLFDNKLFKTGFLFLVFSAIIILIIKIIQQ